MTIDKAIEIINHYLDYPKEEVRKALLLAINTMRKYKKIEQIIASWKDGTIEEKDSIYAFHKIMEVVEDNVD